MKIDTTTLTLCAFAGLVFGYWLAGYMTAYRRMRLKRRIRCWFGRHEAGTPIPMVGGRRVTYCDWCGKTLAEYQVTLNEAKQSTIRRIY